MTTRNSLKLKSEALVSDPFLKIGFQTSFIVKNQVVDLGGDFLRFVLL